MKVFKILMLTILVLSSCKQMSPNDIKYTLKLYYLGGSTEIKEFRVNEIMGPCIRTGRSCPFLVFSAFPEGHGGHYWIEGVVRFEVIKKQLIKDGAYDSNFYY